MVAVLVLSTADFAAAVWTNKQHIASGLATEFSVGYVESLGLRRPSATKADMQRILRRLGASGRTTKKNEDIPANLSLISPNVIPFHDFRLARAFNKNKLAKIVADWKSQHAGPHVLWTFSPLVYGIEHLFDATVYHSVDFLHHFPRIPSDLLLSEEKRLLGVADAVIASSEPIARHLQPHRSSDVLLWENVADVERFILPSPNARQEAAIFAGNMTPSKVDFDLLEELVDRGTRLVLAGPSSIDGRGSDKRLDQLTSHRNVSYLGNLPPDQLARTMNECTVGIIPYLNNSYTGGVFPMKVYEYLAAGLRVVSTDLPSLQRIDDENIVLAANHDQFVKAVEHSVVSSDRDIEVRKESASSYSWTNRKKAARELVRSLI